MAIEVNYVLERLSTQQIESGIPPRQQEELQARLIFETQLAYVVECTDLFVNEIIHRKRENSLIDECTQAESRIASGRTNIYLPERYPKFSNDF